MTAPAIPPQALTVNAIWRAGGKSRKTFRAFGQNMLNQAYTLNPTVQRAILTRSVHFCNRDLPAGTRIKVGYALFHVATASVGEVLFGAPNDTTVGGPTNRQTMYFQTAFEFPYVSAASGLAAGRPKFTWNGGGSYYAYSYAGRPAIPYVVSDPFTLTADILKFTPFGLWSTEQHDTAANGLPTNRLAKNAYADWCEGYTNFSSTTSAIAGVDGGTVDAVSDATSITKYATAYGNPDQIGLTPSFLLIEVDEDVWEQVSILFSSDSTGEGTGEGNGGPVMGDTAGDRYRNKGWFQRWAYRLGHWVINTSKASDGNKFIYDPAKYYWRAYAAVIGNCQAFVNGNLINDLSGSNAPPTYANSTAYVRGAIFKTASFTYIVELGGMSAASGSPYADGSHVVDGTMVLRRIGGVTTADYIHAQIAAVFMRVRDMVPGIRCGKTTAYPALSAVADLGVTSASQTTLNAAYVPGGTKNLINTRIRQRRVGNDFAIDLGLAGIENGYAPNLDGTATEVDGKYTLPPDVAITFTGALSGATSGTLSAVWAGETNAYWVLEFSDASKRTVTLTNGQTAVSWTGAVTATAAAIARQGNWWTEDHAGHLNSAGYDRLQRNLPGDPFKQRGV